MEASAGAWACLLSTTKIPHAIDRTNGRLDSKFETTIGAYFRQELRKGMKELESTVQAISSSGLIVVSAQILAPSANKNKEAPAWEPAFAALAKILVEELRLYDNSFAKEESQLKAAFFRPRTKESKTRKSPPIYAALKLNAASSNNPENSFQLFMNGIPESEFGGVKFNNVPAIAINLPEPMVAYDVHGKEQVDYLFGCLESKIHSIKANKLAELTWAEIKANTPTDYIELAS